MAFIMGCGHIQYWRFGGNKETKANNKRESEVWD